MLLTVTVKDAHGRVNVAPATIVNNSGDTFKVCQVVVGKTIVVLPMAKVAAPAKVENLPLEWEGKDVLAQPVQAINKNCLMPYVVTKGKANLSSFNKSY